MKNFLKYAIAMIVLGAMLPAVSTAAPIDDAKEGIKNRFDAVMDLKQKGLVGEGNDGLLHERGSLNSSQKQTMQGENADRQKLFAELAKESKSTPEAVAKLFAKSTIERQPSGVWVQDGDGDWYKK